MRVILLAGIPAAGKSTYGRWMQEQRGFLHLDVEEPGGLDQRGLLADWNAMFLRGGNSVGFLDRLRKLNGQIVISWGFPPKWLEVVTRLQGAGVQGWWLDGDAAAARATFLSRKTAPVECFDTQMAAIEARRAEINAAFAGRAITTITRGPTFLPEVTLYRQITHGGVE